MDKPPKGYEIKESRVPILIALRPISTLRPHEESVPLELNRIISGLEHDSVMRHPIIVDQETGLVLDGTHRLAALTALKFHSAPCALIDYQNPKIRVERWFRIIRGANLESFKEELKGKQSRSETRTKAEECLANRTCYASLQGDQSCIVFPCRGQGPVEIFREAFDIERLALETGLKVKYTDDNSKPLSPKSLLLSSIKLEKREVVAAAVSKILFPPKTTRHIIPSRPLGISTPLDWMKPELTSGVQDKFVEHLKSKQVKRLPEGSKVGSRRYQEEVFVFD